MSSYFIGLPAWAFSGWNNRYFNTQPSALASYATVFNTVEGNTTFYHIPDEASVEKWHESIKGTDFKFCFKLPKTITHQRKPSIKDLDLFISRIEPLHKYCGPFLLQFPATAGPADLAKIESIVSRLPSELRCAIEVRHDDFFSHPELLHELIAKYKLGRVIMDTRAIFQGDRHHPEVTAALHAKPDLPVLGHVYNELLLVRLLLHPDLVSNDAYIEQWAQRFAHSLKLGYQSYMMIHCPNNEHCPELAIQFHSRLQAAMGDNSLPPLPAWPVPQQQPLL